MPRYSYSVDEVLAIDLDGNATASRLISLTNDSTETVPLLLQSIEEIFPDTAYDIEVFDETAGRTAPATTEDHFFARRVRWDLTASELEPGGQYRFRVNYKRASVAHLDRGYLHMTVGFGSISISNYQLVVKTATQIMDVQVRSLAPLLTALDTAPTDAAAEYELDPDTQQSVSFTRRTVSMNRQFRLDLVLTVVGRIEVPKLPVLTFVVHQLKSGEWFPVGWES